MAPRGSEHADLNRDLLFLGFRSKSTKNIAPPSQKNQERRKTEKGRRKKEERRKGNKEEETRQNKEETKEERRRKQEKKGHPRGRRQLLIDLPTSRSTAPAAVLVH